LRCPAGLPPPNPAERLARRILRLAGLETSYDIILLDTRRHSSARTSSRSGARAAPIATCRNVSRLVPLAELKENRHRRARSVPSSWIDA
jgi:hypothetical protein